MDVINVNLERVIYNSVADIMLPPNQIQFEYLHPRIALPKFLPCAGHWL